MNLSSQWFVGQAVSAVRHGNGSRLALAMVARARKLAGGRSALPRRPAPAFSVALAADRCLAIEGAAGCRLHVVDGEVWVTTEGSLRDVIAGPGDVAVLDGGGRVNVSAFADATLLVAAPRADVAFALCERDGSQVLAVTAGTPWWRRALREAGAALTAFARRRFAATLAAV